MATRGLLVHLYVVYRAPVWNALHRFQPLMGGVFVVGDVLERVLGAGPHLSVCLLCVKPDGAAALSQNITIESPP